MVHRLAWQGQRFVQLCRYTRAGNAHANTVSLACKHQVNTQACFSTSPFLERYVLITIDCRHQIFAFLESFLRPFSLEDYAPQTLRFLRTWHADMINLSTAWPVLHSHCRMNLVLQKYFSTFVHRRSDHLQVYGFYPWLLCAGHQAFCQCTTEWNETTLCMYVEAFC